MIPQTVIDEAEKNGSKFLHGPGGAVYSVYPPETMFGYTVWAHMVPPFKPEHTLILGYGGGTVAELMRKIWGPQLKITGIEIEPRKFQYNEYRLKIMDAKEYVWENTRDSFFRDTIPLFNKDKYDYVCIDVWNDYEVPAFVFETEFVVRLREMATKLVCMNIHAKDIPKVRAYYDYGYKFDRTVSVEDNQVLWWSIAQ